MASARDHDEEEEREPMAEMKGKLKATLEEGLRAERVSVESEGPREDRRLMLTVVSPAFRGLAKVEERDDLIWRLIKAHDEPCPSHARPDDQVDVGLVKHLKLRAWTPEDDQLHTLHRQAPAFFADNK